jgi:hypothetical protein
MTFTFQLAVNEEQAFQFSLAHPGSAVEALRSFGITRDISRRIVKDVIEVKAYAVPVPDSTDILWIRYKD